MSQNCIKAVRQWHEFLLQRPVTYMQIDAEENLLSIPSPRIPREDEVAFLGMLVQRQMEWRGVASVRKMETVGMRVLSGVRRRGKVLLYEIERGLCCVNKGRVVLFEQLEHMRLYLSIVESEAEIPLVIYGPLCSALSVRVDGHYSQVRLATFDGPRDILSSLHSEALWLRLSSVMWSDAERVSIHEWEAVRHRGPDSIESRVMSAIGHEDSFHQLHYPFRVRILRSFIIVQRDGQGSHVRCLFILVRHTEYGEDACFGSVLFVSYVGYEARLSKLMSDLDLT